MHLHTDTWHPCVQQAHDHTDVQVELAIMQYYDAVVVVEMGGGSFIVQKADNAKVFFFFVFCFVDGGRGRAVEITPTIDVPVVLIGIIRSRSF